MSTLKEVARAAGVGTTTVSVILNTPDQAGRFSEETIERVRKVARDLNYHPNHRARAFRGGKSFSIGLVLESDSDENLISQRYWSSMIGGVHRVLQRNAYQFVLISAFGGEKGVDIALRHLKERRIDGIILSEAVSADTVPALKEAKGPIAAVNFPDSPDGIPTVVNDDAVGLRAAIEYLKRCNHQHLQWLGPTNWFDRSAEKRCNTFLQICSELQLKSGSCLFDYDPSVGQRQRISVAGLAEQALANCLKARNRNKPTAVISFNEECAVGAYRALAQAGLSVPGDVSAIAFDNYIGEYLSPPLTCIDSMGFRAGEMAAELIVQLARQYPRMPRGLPRLHPVLPELCLRQSVAQLPS